MGWGVHLPHPSLCKGKRHWVAKAIGGWQGGPGEGPNTEARNRGALRIICLISLERQERILNVSPGHTGLTGSAGLSSCAKASGQIEAGPNKARDASPTFPTSTFPSCIYLADVHRALLGAGATTHSLPWGASSPMVETRGHQEATVVSHVLHWGE